MIKWHYRYVGKCEEILPDTNIILEPDKYGRWAIIGSVFIKTDVMPGYEKIGEKISVPIAWIFQKKVSSQTDETIFTCEFPHVYDANIGFSVTYFSNKELRALMNIIEEKLSVTVNCFKNIVE